MFSNLVEVQRPIVVKVPSPLPGVPVLYVPLALGQVVRVDDFEGGPGGYGLWVGGGLGVLHADEVEEVEESRTAWFLTAQSVNQPLHGRGHAGSAPFEEVTPVAVTITRTVFTTVVQPGERIDYRVPFLAGELLHVERDFDQDEDCDWLRTADGRLVSFPADSWARAVFSEN